MIENQYERLFYLSNFEPYMMRDLGIPARAIDLNKLGIFVYRFTQSGRISPTVYIDATPSL